MRRKAAFLLANIFIALSNLQQSFSQDILKTGQELFDRSEFSAAQAYYERFLADHPNDPRNHLAQTMIAESALKADFLQTGRQNSRIAGLFQQTIRQNPKGFAVQGAQFRLNEILYNQGRYQEAVTAWKKFLKKYRTSYLRYEALLNLAMAQAAQNLWNEAERTTNELTSLNPAYEEQDAVKFLKGVFAFMRLDYQTAAAYLEKMSVPTEAGLYWRALNYGRRATCFGRAKISRAIKQISKRGLKRTSQVSSG